MDPTMLMLLGLGALLLFFMFSSRKKQKARQENLKTNLVPGAEVMTTFGVYGTVLTISEEDHIVTIESGPGTVLRIHQQAIGHIEPVAGVATDGLGSDAAPAAGEDSDRLDRYRTDEKRYSGESSRTADDAPASDDVRDAGSSLEDGGPAVDDADRRDERGDNPKA